jgi:hypothetical protein
MPWPTAAQIAAPSPAASLTVVRRAERPFHCRRVIRHRQRDALEDGAVDMRAALAAVEAKQRASAPGRVTGCEPVRQRQQPVAAGRQPAGLRVERVLQPVGSRCRLLAMGSLQQRPVPADHPHAAADPGALIQVLTGPRREVGPVAVVRAPGGGADRHRGDVRAQRQQHGAVFFQATAQRLDRLVVGRGVHRQAGRNAGGPGRPGGHLAEPAARGHKVEEHVARYAC